MYSIKSSHPQQRRQILETRQTGVSCTRLIKTTLNHCITASGSFSSTPSCKISQEGGEKSPNLPSRDAPFSILLGNFGCALINQQGNFGWALFNPPRQLWARPFQWVRQQTTTIYISPDPPHSLRVPPLLCLHCWSSLTLRPRPVESHIPLHPFFCAWYPRMRPRGLDMAIWRQHRQSDWSQDQAGHYISSWNDPAVEKTASKSLAASAWGRGHVVLATLLGCL